jgi:hypothetical protein
MAQRGGWFLSLTAIFVMVSAAAWADDFTYSFLPANTFSGTAPAGTLTAEFFDASASKKCGAATSGVCLIITSNMAAGENIDPGNALFLNVTPSLADTASFLTDLTFTLQANTAFSQAAGVTTNDESNPGQIKADGSPGLFDVLLTYTPSTKAFTSGESQTYLITDAAHTFTADDFLTLSGDVPINDPCTASDPGNPGPCFAAAIHVQNTPSGGSGSGWVGAFGGGGGGITGGPVPEPKSIGLSLIGCGVMFLVSRKRRQSA